MKLRTSLLFVLLASLLHVSPAQTYAVSRSIPLGGTGAWDYLRADSESRRLYVSHASQVVVLDLDSSKVVGKITGLGFIHGIVIVNGLHKGFLSDGQKNEIVVFDPATLAITRRIPTAENPNSMVFDPPTGRLFVGHKPSKSMTVINAATGAIEGRIALGASPEFPVSDNAGNIFVNTEDTSEILDLDAKSLAVKARWPVAPCKSPSGLAIDLDGHRLFAACDNRMMAIVDAISGKLISTVPSGDEPDAAGYDPVSHLAFASNGGGTLTVVSCPQSAGCHVVQTLPTQAGARTMTIDGKTHVIYLSTAKLGPPPAPTRQNPHPPRHPTALPGSFRLLVVSPAAAHD